MILFFLPTNHFSFSFVLHKVWHGITKYLVILSYHLAVEQKLRDKLAAAARDKLAHAAKEKQLQAERKRKAAMFISMLKGGAAAAQPNTEVQPPGGFLVYCNFFHMCKSPQ